MGRGMGQLQKDVMAVLDKLGDELGRPPLRQEISEALGIDGTSGTRSPALTRALQRLTELGYLEAKGGGLYVQIKTLDGRAVAWRREVGN